MPNRCDSFLKDNQFLSCDFHSHQIIINQSIQQQKSNKKTTNNYYPWKKKEEEEEEEEDEEEGKKYYIGIYFIITTINVYINIIQLLFVFIVCICIH